MIRNILRYSFVAIFGFLVLTVVIGWTWTQVSINSSKAVIHSIDNQEARDFLLLHMEPIERALCFYRLIESKQGDTFIFHNYSFFGKSCGRVKLILGVSTRKIH